MKLLVRIQNYIYSHGSRACVSLLVGYLIVTLSASPVFANQYRDMFEQIAHTDRETWAPSLAEVKFSQSLLVYNQYFEELSERFAELMESIETMNNNGSQLLGELEALWTTPNIDNYQMFIKTALRYRLLSSHIRGKVASAREIGETFMENRDFYKDFCVKQVAKIPPLGQVPSLPSFVSRDGNVYTRYNHVFSGSDSKTFSEDPKAEAAAFTSLGAAVLVGIGLYASTAGVTFWAAAATLFSTTASGGGVALVGTGPGAVIILAAIGVAVVVGVAVTEHENRERKKKAKKRYKREMQLYEEAKAWYIANQVTHEEFKEIAGNICRSSLWQERIMESRENLHKNIQILEPQLTTLSEAEERLLGNDKKIQGIADEYEKSLIFIYSAKYLKSLRESLLSQEKENAAIRYFNENIKPEANRLSLFYTQHRNDCFVLEEEYDRKHDLLKFHENVLISSYRDAGNEESSFFKGQLLEGIETILTVFKKRVNRCYEQQGLDGGVGLIYSL